MHDLARARLRKSASEHFVIADFTQPRWAEDLGSFDAIVTMQAVHELRHKLRAVTLHLAAYELLRPGGLYLVCDHVAGSAGMENGDLLDKRGLVLHRACKTR